MENVILVIHLILALAIIGVVLIQRSEGGGLGIGGGGGGMGGLMTPGGTASVLTKVTAVLGACFFATSLTLAILAGTHSDTRGLLETYEVGAEETLPENAEETSDTPDESVTKDIKSEEQPAKKPSVPIGE
jgi:preprotein translocase subunit SecG